MLNKAEKAVEQYKLDQEKAVLRKLELHYEYALNGINERLQVLQAAPETQSKVYQKQYQETLKKQVSAILENLRANEYSTLDRYMHDAYTTGFVGTMYDLHHQDVPLLIPINQAAILKTVQHDTKLTHPLYDELGIDTKRMSRFISREISRGLASGLTYDEVARNIKTVTRAPLSRAKVIARTEGHRIQQASSQDAADAAKEKGADIVKQWDSTLDGDTRPNHRQLDGQIRELDKPFEVGGYSPMYPGDFGEAGEDCNCRCVSLKRARAALDEDELKTLKERAEFFELDKSDSFADFEKKYLQAANEESKHQHDDAVVSPFVKTSDYRNLFNNLNEPVATQRAACKSARDMLEHRSGTKYEDLTFIDTVTGKQMTRNDYDVAGQVLPSRAMRTMVTSGEPYTVIAIHNHPGSSVPSIADINTAYKHKYKYGVVACHNGIVMRYEITGEYNETIVNHLLDRANRDLYNTDGGSADALTQTLNQLKEENVVLEVFSK